MTTTTSAPRPRFTVFNGDRGPVLRDHSNDTDYPFISREGAFLGADMRRDGGDYIGSPAGINAYGKPGDDQEDFE